MERPNVLFIMSDQHSGKVMGHKGYNVKTPNLDKLAKTGVSFDNAVTQNPICTPSRVSFFSGQFCHNHLYYGLDGADPGGLKNIFGHFREAGYKTAAIGKIHCPENWVRRDCDCFDDIYHSGFYTRFLEEKGLGKLEDSGHLQEFPHPGYQPLDARPSNLDYADSTEGYIAGKSKEFIKSCAENEQPFFAFASLQRPHECYTPSKEFWDMYEDAELPVSMFAETKDKSPALHETAGGFKNGFWSLFEPKDYVSSAKRKLRGYLGCVSQVDYAVGEMVEFLKETGVYDNTVIIYTSDHGEYACHHNIMEKAPGICSDMVLKIPLIVTFPNRFKPDGNAKPLVQAVDLATTLCTLCGVPEMDTDGRDFSKILFGGHVRINDLAVSENLWSKSVYKGNFHFIRYPKTLFEREYPNGFGELYDLEKDPFEMTNLYFDLPDTIKELENELFDWLVTTTRPKTACCVDNCEIASDGKLPLSKVAETLKNNRNYI